MKFETIDESDLCFSGGENDLSMVNRSVDPLNSNQKSRKKSAMDPHSSRKVHFEQNISRAKTFRDETKKKKD